MAALEKYLDGLNFRRQWEVKTSRHGGRGIFATNELSGGVELYRDPALVLGPRTDHRCLTVCISCHRVAPQKQCPGKCGFTVCAEDCKGPFHDQECKILSSLNLTHAKKVAIVAPLRAIFLSQEEREILKNLERHENDPHELLLGWVKSHLCPEDLQAVRHSLQVFDATGYEVPVNQGGSLRGIYPASALMNHDCTPNTRHWFDEDGKMVVMTTRSVAAGEELTTSYTSLMWGTYIRRLHLKKTKNFICKCRRCSDPTEYGSSLMGLYCMKKGCGGIILPLRESPYWNCPKCGTNVPATRVAKIQEMVAEVVAGLSKMKLKQRLRMLLKSSMVPSCNQYAVDQKLALVRILGHSPGHTWKELSMEELILKKLLCQQLITLVEVLKLGICLLSEELSQELAMTSSELSKR